MGFFFFCMCVFFGVFWGFFLGGEVSFFLFFLLFFFFVNPVKHYIVGQLSTQYDIANNQ